MVRISSFLRPGFLLLAAIGLFSCDSGSTNSTTSNPPTQPTTLEGEETIGWSGTYRIVAGRILLDYGSDTVELRGRCTGENSSELELDSNRVPQVDTFEILLQNDSLALIYRSDDSLGALDDYGRLFVRASGSTKGYEGVWKLDSYITIPAGGKPVRDSFSTEEQLVATDWTLTLAAGKFSNIQRAKIDWASNFVRKWEAGLMRLLPEGGEVVATRESENVVRLTGRRTGEIVRVRRLTRHPFIVHGGDWEYSSSNSTHSTFVQQELPRTCPDMASWYSAFLRDNASLEAGRMLTSLPGVSGGTGAGGGHAGGAGSAGRGGL